MKKYLLALAFLLPAFTATAHAQDALAIANEVGTGTTLNKLAKITGAPSTAIIAATTDTDNIIGIVVAGAGTTNNAIVAVLGSPNCVFDATTVVAGDYVTNSSTTAGACHDAGATRPTGSQVIGRALASGAGGSTIAVSMDKGFANTAGSGSFANPTATASDTAVNGSATTAMRSDAAPPVQKGTNAAFGIVRGDTSTINCVAGVCTAVGGAATTITPGTTTVSGATAPCLIDNSSTTVMGCAAVGTNVLTALAANLSANGGLTKTVFSGAKALATGAISSAACTSAQTDTATGTLTTDVVLASFNGDPTAVTGYVPLTAGMLTIIAYPTADTVNFKVCNNTNASVTPGAITLNWRVVR